MNKSWRKSAVQDENFYIMKDIYESISDMKLSLLAYFEKKKLLKIDQILNY